MSQQDWALFQRRHSEIPLSDLDSDKERKSSGHGGSDSARKYHKEATRMPDIVESSFESDGKPI